MHTQGSGRVARKGAILGYRPAQTPVPCRRPAHRHRPCRRQPAAHPGRHHNAGLAHPRRQGLLVTSRPPWPSSLWRSCPSPPPPSTLAARHHPSRSPDPQQNQHSLRHAGHRAGTGCHVLRLTDSDATSTAPEPATTSDKLDRYKDYEVWSEYKHGLPMCTKPGGSKYIPLWTSIFMIYDDIRSGGH